jgi:signal peptidase II
LVALILSVSVGCDQLSKNVVQHRLIGVGRRSFLDDVFRLEYAENSGAFLSLGSALPAPIRDTILTWGVAVVVLVVFLAAIAKPGLGLGQVIGYSLVAGGGLSNLWDRIARDGYVIDFMNLGIGPVRTGIFNVADVAIVAGVLVLVFPRNARPTPPSGQNSHD